jgi:PhnB protein
MTAPVPEGYPRVTPYLIVAGAADAIGFYTEVLGFTERMRMPGPDGLIGHAELELGESVLMLSDENAEMGMLGPRSTGGTAVTIHTYVDDVDGTFDRALKAGAKSLRDVEDQFYGDRSGQLEDPFGHRWNLATHVEDVSPDEMSRRAAELAATG